MNFLATNALGKAVTKWHQGREYLVAPSTTIVEGVLAGSKGPLYYPAAETHKAGPAWNGVPITLYHPMDEYGNNVEVEYPGVRDRQEIGFTRETRTNNGEKLQHQAWFDVQKTAEADKRFGTDVLNRLKSGIAPIGTSTGLYTKDVPAQSGANFNGRPYSHVATNHRPNHLAVLPDQVGACSINDGCGILINGKQGKSPISKQDDRGRQLTLTQNGWVSLTHNKRQLMAALSQDQLADRIDRLERIILNAGGVVQDPNDIDEDDDEGLDTRVPRNLLGVPVGKKSTKNAEQGRHPKEGTYQGMAHTAAKSGYSDTRQNPLELDRFSSSNGDDAANPIEDEDTEIGQGDRSGVSKGPDGPIIKNNKGTNNMSPEMYGGAPDPHAMSKQAAGATLQTDHDEAMGHAQGAIAASKGDKPERAAVLHQKAAVAHETAATDARRANKPEEAIPHDSAASLHRTAASMQTATCNRQKPLPEPKPTRSKPVAFNRTAVLQHLTRNCACDKDLVALNSMSDTMLQFIVANEKAEGSNADVTGSGTKTTGGTEEEQDGNNSIAKKDENLVKGGSKVPGMNRAVEWLNSMPEELRPVWNSAVEADLERRQNLVERITANVADPKAKAEMQKQFMNIKKYDLPQLRQLAQLIPQPRMVQNNAALNPFAMGMGEAQPVYLGANGAQAMATNAQPGMDDVLDIPTLNFAAEQEERAKSQTA